MKLFIIKKKVIFSAKNRLNKWMKELHVLIVYIYIYNNRKIKNEAGKKKKKVIIILIIIEKT